MTFRGAIVIVNFNSGPALVRCLASIAEHASLATTIVIDNASTDNSTALPALGAPGVELHVNNVNVGFGSGVNQGVRHTSADVVLILNPDCVLTAGAVERLEEELRRHPECAVVGPQIRNDDGSIQGSARGDPSIVTGLFGRTTLLTRLFPRSALARRNVRTDVETVTTGESFAVDWVSGACMLARRSAFANVGGFDERFFLYWEDADLCRRLRHAGHTIRYVPSSVVAHTQGVSSRGVPGLATRAFHESAFRYYSVHVARNPLARALAWSILTARCRWKLATNKRTE
jgi:GT2 family glycosyltransferase